MKNRLMMVVDGELIDFETLTGLQHPKTTEPKKLEIFGRAAMKVDDRISHCLIMEVGDDYRPPSWIGEIELSLARLSIKGDQAAARALDKISGTSRAAALRYKLRWPAALLPAADEFCLICGAHLQADQTDICVACETHDAIGVYTMTQCSQGVTA